MIEMKKELITKSGSGTRLLNLPAQNGMAKLTILTTLKNKEAIKVANVANGVKTLTVKDHQQWKKKINK
jgi:hypothetical protein